GPVPRWRCAARRQSFLDTMIPSRLFALAIHSLLHDHPIAFIGDDEAVQIKIETVLDGGAVDLGDKAACSRELAAVKADAIADGQELLRRQRGLMAPTAADMQTKLAAERSEPALKRSEHARGDARGMPVHSHHRAERLKPERMRQPPEKFVAP